MLPGRQNRTFTLKKSTFEEGEKLKKHRILKSIIKEKTIREQTKKRFLEIGRLEEKALLQPKYMVLHESQTTVSFD